MAAHVHQFHAPHHFQPGARSGMLGFGLTPVRLASPEQIDNRGASQRHPQSHLLGGSTHGAHGTQPAPPSPQLGSSASRGSGGTPSQLGRQLRPATTGTLRGSTGLSRSVKELRGGSPPHASNGATAPAGLKERSPRPKDPPAINTNAPPVSGRNALPSPLPSPQKSSQERLMSGPATGLSATTGTVAPETGHPGASRPRTPPGGQIAIASRGLSCTAPPRAGGASLGVAAASGSRTVGAAVPKPPSIQGSRGVSSSPMDRRSLSLKGLICGGANPPPGTSQAHSTLSAAAGTVPAATAADAQQDELMHGAAVPKALPLTPSLVSSPMLPTRAIARSEVTLPLAPAEGGRLEALASAQALAGLHKVSAPAAGVARDRDRGARESPPRSPSPPSVQPHGKQPVDAYTRTLRERDDEIARLREQVRMVSRSPTWSPVSADGTSGSSFGGDTAGSRRLLEENQELKHEVEQLQEALKSYPPRSGITGPAVPQSEEPTVRAAAMSANPAAVATASKGSGVSTAHGEQVAVAERQNVVLREENDLLREELEKYRQEQVNSNGVAHERSVGSGSEPPSVQQQARQTSQGARRPAGSPQRGSPRSSLLPSRVVHLQRQLKEQEDDRRSLEDMLREAQGEVARIGSRVLQLQERQACAVDDEAFPPEDGSASGSSSIGFRTVGPAGRLGAAAPTPMRNKKQQAAELQHMLSTAHRDRQKLQEEIRQRWEQLRSEREQWRQERESLLADQRRRDKAEETLRKQNAAVQERLDRLQLMEAEQEQQRRQSRASHAHSTLPSSTATEPHRSSACGNGDAMNESTEDIREVGLQKRSEVLESQIQRQTLELARLHKEVQQLEDDRAIACAKLLASKNVNLTIGVPGSSSAPLLPFPSTSTGPASSQDRADDVRQQSQPFRARGRGAGSFSTVSSSSSLGKGQRGSSSSMLPRRGSGRGSAANRSDSSSGLTPPAPPCIPPSQGGRIGPAVPSLNLPAPTFWSSVARYKMEGEPSTSDDESSTGSSSAATETRKRTHTSLCAVFGDGPLKKIEGTGWYFRLRINSGCSNWVGGFAIGVTMSTPSTLMPLPDRAARVPRSWIAGYWGRTFANGQERLSGWTPQALRPGDEVGFLVGLEGECVVFVNEEERCRFADPPVPVSRADGSDVQLTSLVDASSAATAVTFLNGLPPAPSPPVPAPPPQPQAGAGRPPTAPMVRPAPSTSTAPIAGAGSRPGGVLASVGGGAGTPNPGGGLNHSTTGSPMRTSPPPPSLLPSPARNSAAPTRGSNPCSSWRAQMIQPQRSAGCASPPVPPMSLLSSAGGSESIPAAAAAARRVPQLALPLPVH